VARRLAERGVRFIQLYHGTNPLFDSGDWDAHEKLRENHTRQCAKVDRPIAGLLRDLKRRGMFDRTLVVWATEFGRTPNIDIRTPCGPPDQNVRTGRDHHIHGFSAWMAGAGVRPGVIHGATDELGFHAVEHPHYVTDLHATVLHLMGLDSAKLEIPGRKRLEMDHGAVIREILA
jgi:arylsulfatase A-like enzyme